MLHATIDLISTFKGFNTLTSNNNNVSPNNRNNNQMQAMVSSPFTTNYLGFLTLMQHIICIKVLVLSQMFNHIKEMTK